MSAFEEFLDSDGDLAPAVASQYQAKVKIDRIALVRDRGQLDLAKQQLDDYWAWFTDTGSSQLEPTFLVGLLVEIYARPMRCGPPLCN